MIKAIILGHPQSKNLLSRRVFRSKHVEPIKIACGTTKIDDADYRESADFFPTYASYNSCLFETSVILTVWEHADELIGDDNIAILHTDITPHYNAGYLWRRLDKQLFNDVNLPIGLTVSSAYQGYYDEWEVPNYQIYTPKMDPMKIHAFDNKIHVWEYIKLYDLDTYEWAMDNNPYLIYSHQFACSRKLFDILGTRLMMIVNKLRLQDVGFWTPHMFERLIALYLARFGSKPLLTTAFWHFSSSGAFGPGELSLYGPRGLRYYRTSTRLTNIHA